MDGVVEALDAQQRELAALVEPLDADGLRRPSACEGWTIGDVLVHLAQTDELAVASVAGRFSEVADAAPRMGEMATVDDWAGAAVDAERGGDPLLARARWATSAAAQLDTFARCDPSARVPWVAGEMAARTLATTRLSEAWIHSGDVAAGLGSTVEPTDRLWHVARLVQRTVPYSFGRAGRELHGPVAFELTSPSGRGGPQGEARRWRKILDGPASPAAQARRSMSPGRQVWSNHASSGP